MKIETVSKYNEKTVVFESQIPVIKRRVGGEIVVSDSPSPSDPNYQSFLRHGGIKGAFESNVCIQCNLFHDCKRVFAGLGSNAQRIYFEAVGDNIDERDATCLNVSSF